MKRKKVKLFSYQLHGIFVESVAKLEQDVNEFLQGDGKSIKVLDVMFQTGDTYYSVLVYYEEL